MAEKSRSGIQANIAEMRRRDEWAQAAFGHNDLPFSFRYGGRASKDVIGGWSSSAQTAALADGRTQQTRIWRDGATGLEVRCVSVTYADFPIVEWTVYLKNTGDAPTPILEQIQALDIQVDGEGAFVLHHNQGDTCGPNAYEPLESALIEGTDLRFAPVGGRPTSLAFPYFNLQDDARGMIIALGWPGQWAARFVGEAHGCVRVQGGQELTHLTLLPGEEIRTPLVALMFWEGAHGGAEDAMRAQNLWRRWMFAHNVPRRNGVLPPPMSAMCAGVHQNETGEKDYIDLLIRNDAEIDYWWMDAGWYPGAPGAMGEWTQAGTWRPDPVRFPGGVKAVADFAHARDMKLILWFELERVSPGSDWWEHPDWLLALRPEDRRFRLRPDIGTPEFTLEEAERNQIREDDRLFNLGHPAALRFLTDYVSGCIEAWGLDIFRLDFNISPLLFWRAADAGPDGTSHDRQGMTENKYVCGLLAFFDELLRRHPHLLIDSCASGGRRIDLETLRRAVVHTRSDYWNVSTTGDQCQTHGLASWNPYYLCTTTYDDAYRFRSNLAPSLEIHYDPSQKDMVDWALLRQRVAEWRSLAPYYYGDYYPLTVWSNQADAIMAWQFDRPEHGDGVVQAFRRAEAQETEPTLCLHGLEPEATYQIRDLDLSQPVLLTGRQLMETGLRVITKDRPGATIVIYERTATDVSR
jgi:alpha-galactosidase